MIAHSEGRPLSSVRLLPHRYAIGRAMGTDADWADWGYLNLAAGWADAERSMQWLHEKVVDTGRVTFVNGTVETLETETSTQKESKNIDTQGGGCVTGARLSDGRILSADLVIVAAGAWTPSLVDLSGQAVATGQCVAYLRLTEDEQAKLAKMPVSLNLTDGCFVIPPRDCVLKIGRHAYGYLNPQTLSSEPLGEKDGDRHRRTEKKPATVSKPRTHLTDPSLSIPAEGETDLRRALRCMIPWPDLAERPFFKTRLCWYTDTATGDWIIDYHPSYENLFIATGGSGHAFKFLPILGDKVVDCLMGRCPQDFRDKWKWKGGVDRNRDDKGTETTEGVVSEDLAVEESISTEDGSRGGKPGQILEIELAKSGRTSLHLEANGNC
ncbi:FAD dependent oxidoreductase-domain-containing protein [Poronia punctata]|nr:FAD dependent oxidoreductase-domain-containing protein [Poronia punctata]